MMKTSWLLTRLSKMPLPEIPWRVYEKAKKIADKKTRFSCPKSTALPDKRIFLLAKHADAEELKSLFPEVVAHHFAVADAALENRFDSFGIEVVFDGDIDWHLDPVTKGRWPEKFWGDIVIRDKSLGGVKSVWEYNRLYFLFSLGLCFRISGEEKYAAQVGRIIRSWIEANPYPVGVNWASGIEAGVRLANLVWALGFLKEYAFSNDDLRAINRFVWFHGQHLFRYPSRYSSSNNHLLAEGFGLFVAGLCFPHLMEAPKWLAKGRAALDAEAGRQVLPDGGSFEYSITYLSFVVDFFLLYRQMCQSRGLTYSPVVDERLEKACRFIRSIMDKGGQVPNMGDQDSAVLVGFGMSNADNFSSILNTGAVLFDAPELGTGGADIKTWLLTGAVHVEKGDAGPGAVMHKESGLSVIRDRVDGKELVFAGNAMPLGMGPLYAHGHLDALSFTLGVDGKEILVDPGTYLYHRGGKWRTYFRSTKAHNTIRLNGLDLSKQTGDFMFGRPYKITKHSLAAEENEVCWQAGHDAYLKQQPRAEVERVVVWRGVDQTFVFTDTVKTEKQVQVELFFHCHPDCGVEIRDTGVLICREDVRLWLRGDPALAAEVIKGAEDPVCGWYSPAFNEIAPASTIRFYGTLEAGGVLRTEMRVAVDGFAGRKVSGG